MSADLVSPDCRGGKHHACSGDAWDEDLDQLAACACPDLCHRDATPPTIPLEP